MLRRIRLFALLWFAVGSSARAQSTADEVAAACTRAEAAGDWAAAARLMHPDALRRLRAIFGAMMEGSWTRADSASTFGFRTRDELLRAPDTLVYARVLGHFLGQSAELRAAMATARYSPLGHVMGRADTAYAVGRLSVAANGYSRSAVVVHPVVRVAGEWRCLLRPPLSDLLPEPGPPPPAAS